MSGDYILRYRPFGHAVHGLVITAGQRMHPWTVSCDCGYRKPVYRWQATQEAEAHSRLHQLEKLLEWNLR